MFGKFKEIYFVGIGGSGMSGIAEILHNLGYKISGSDNSPGEATEHLEKIGVRIYDSHAAANIGSANVVVISSAVKENNPEVVEAKRLGIPVIKRAEMLGELMRLKYSIGVSGTHGKTTTTSMLGKILADAKMEPTVIVGGIVAGKGSGAELGNGEYMVAEADEYDRSFLKMYPSMAIITNVEPDHLECYDGLEDLENSFVAYMNKVPFYGQVVYSADDPVLVRLIKNVTRPTISFGLEPGADYQAVDIIDGEGKSSFSVFYKGDLLGKVHLNVPGEHNVRNALAAIASACELEVPFEVAAESMSRFVGVARRFEIKGKINDIMVVDDYAHHPTEIDATLKTAKKYYNRRLVVAFQPHLFSRTKMFYKEFAQSLLQADVCLLLDIFPAREIPIEGVTSMLIEESAVKLGHKQIKTIGPKANAVVELLKVVRPGDMIITMGAGSITHINPELLESLKNVS
ncbi:MAG: UDP-N-acetylmuramate--L-alanine ligase [Candidatus Zixiibacteriota bacterium]